MDLPRATPTLEVRDRFERRANPDFDDRTVDGRSDLFSRVRVGAKFDLALNWKAELQYQYSHDLVRGAARNYSTEASDANLAYIETRQRDWTVTVGRQKIAIGKQRLIGPLEWVNVPRSYDGVRLRNRNLDLWAARIGLGPVEPDNLVLAGATYKGSKLGETSLFAKHDKVSGRTIDIFSLDHLATKSIGGWNMEFEGVLQGGRNAGLRHEAWALHGRIARQVSKGVTGYVEANAASGGSNPSVSRTFDNLYPTNHPYYGLADLQGWRNMNELAVGLEIAPRKNLGLRLDWHTFSLRDPADAWYGASGAPNRWAGGVFRDPTGRSGRKVGSEIDLEVNWQANRMTGLQAGVGVFTPERFVRSVRGAGDRQVWAFVQMQYRY
jgi:hypothetical protein